MRSKVAGKKYDFFIVVLLIAAAAAITLIFRPKVLIGGILLTIPPTLFLCLRETKNYWKIFLGVFIFGLLFGFFFDFIETYSGAWFVPDLVFPWRILGVEPVDDLIGFVIMTAFMLVFYEHFLDDEKNTRISPQMVYALIPAFLAVFTVIIIFFAYPARLFISHAYLKGGIAAILFPIIYAIRNPRIILKLCAVAIFFFFVWLIMEVTAVKIGGWVYPGQYIGWMTLFGVGFPAEEMLFWMLFYAATIVAYYERFIDDGK